MIVGATKQEVRLIHKAVRHDFQRRYDSDDLRRELYDQQKGCCALCHWAIQGYDGIFCHIEHMIPVRLWAEFYVTSHRSVEEIVLFANDLKNLRLSHIRCGIRKSDRDLDELPEKFFVGRPKILSAKEIRQRKADQANRCSLKKAKYKQKIITWYKSLKSITWIAERIGMGTRTICLWLEEWGIQRRPFRPMLSPKRKYKKQIIAWYKSGKNEQWIAERIGVVQSTVHLWLKEWNIKTYTSGEQLTSRNKHKFKKQIIAWYKSGKTTQWIAKRVGVSFQTICRWLKEWNIKTRSSHTSPTKQRCKKRIIHWYKSGKSTGWIARKLGLCKSSIWKWLKEWRVVRSISKAKSLPQKQKYKNRILSWRKSGKTDSWIAKRIGVSDPTVSRWLKEWSTQI